jgi:hypothetical protein
MRMTEKEQALLTTVIDAWLKNYNPLLVQSGKPFCDLYDAVVDAEIEGGDDTVDFEIELISEGPVSNILCDDDMSEEERAEASSVFVDMLRDYEAVALFEALKKRMVKMYEEKTTAAGAATDANPNVVETDDVNKVDTDTLARADVVIENGKVVKDRFNRFADTNPEDRFKFATGR